MSIFSSGIEDNPTVFYKIIRGSTDQTNKYDTFYLQQRKEGSKTYADIKVNHPLDYERIKEYNLTVRVEVSDMNTYVLDDLWCQPIKLIQLVTTSEFHEYFGPNI